MLLDAGQVAAVSCARFAPIHLVFLAHRDLIQLRVAIGEAVGHDQVEHVRRVEALDLAGVRLARLQLVGLCEVFLALREGDVELAGLGVGHVEIDEQVVKIVRTQHEKALNILKENEGKLHEIAKYLLDKETITGEEFMEIYERNDADVK